MHLASFAIAQNGELLHKTFYDIKNLSKLQRILKSKDENVIYFKGEQWIGVFGIGIDEAGEIIYKTLYADKKQNRLKDEIIIP